ncbi:MAG: DDE-type integrase/transposase/recombinase [Methylotenera sp.]|nr:DDE-type integrase/transposase/recombinase [Methylotenera sp.]
MVKEIMPPMGRQVVMPMANVLALRARNPWSEATDRARQIALAREDVLLDLQARQLPGVSFDAAIKSLQAAAEAGYVKPYLLQQLKLVSKKGRKYPTRSVLFDWRSYYDVDGQIGLLPEWKGRVVEAASWWGYAIEYYNVAGSKPSMGAVFNRLVEVDGFNVTYDQVRHYLNSVPAMLGRNSPARIGKNLYRLTQKKYIQRSTENALAGDVYVADGYRADVYLAHPVTGDIFRPELTVGMDLNSRYIIGWRADEHEGTIAVQNMWAEAIDRHQHVPVFLYIDNGSGYKNKLMSDEVVGFYSRVGIQEIIHAIPGNPHGKGWIEQFFRIMKDDFLRLWQPQFYCGTDMADEVLQRTVREVKAGRLQLPTMAQFADAFNDWLVRYHNRPHPENKQVTRAQLWAALVPIAPHATLPELKRQAVTLTVRRASLTHGKRMYGHPDLLAFNGQKLVLEYDLMVDEIAVIRTEQGRWVCDAHLVKRIDAIATNRLEEKRADRAEDAIKRLEKKMDEQKARAGRVIDAEAVADNALSFDGEFTQIDDDQPLILDLTE